MIKEEKIELRNKILSLRNALYLKYKMKLDEKIYNNLFNDELFIKAKNIFIYIGFGTEVDTKPIIKKALNENKKIYIPKIYKDDKSMKAIRLNSFDDLKENSMGILEPIEDNDFINKKDIDLIIVPGVVFDEKGNRIGYGGGYYDRYLSEIQSKNNKLVLAYEFQVLDCIIEEDHDIKMDYILTNEKIRKIIK